MNFGIISEQNGCSKIKCSDGRRRVYLVRNFGWFRAGCVHFQIYCLALHSKDRLKDLTCAVKCHYHDMASALLMTLIWLTLILGQRRKLMHLWRNREHRLDDKFDQDKVHDCKLRQRHVSKYWGGDWWGFHTQHVEEFVNLWKLVTGDNDV